MYSQVYTEGREAADLRIASKRAYYDNNKPYGEHENITLYVYNAGPNVASGPVVRAGYSFSMDYNAVTATLRRAKALRASRDVLAGSLNWTQGPDLAPTVDGWDIVSPVPDILVGEVVEITLSFPMTHEWSYKDYEIWASVSSSTQDLHAENNRASYIITPNHSGDGYSYWKTRGNLSNLDYNGLKGGSRVTSADLRIAALHESSPNSTRSAGSTWTFLVFNRGPAVATKSVLTVGPYRKALGKHQRPRCSIVQRWVPNGVIPLSRAQDDGWRFFDDAYCDIDGENLVCGLPDIPPSVMYHVTMEGSSIEGGNLSAMASISSYELNPNANAQSTVRFTMPNLKSDGSGWQASNMSKLVGASAPAASRTCSAGWLPNTPIAVSLGESERSATLANLVGQDLATIHVIGGDSVERELLPTDVTKFNQDTSNKIIAVSFLADDRTKHSYNAQPDSLLYLVPTTIQVGQHGLRVGYWMPVRMLWPGAVVRGMGGDRALRPVYVTEVRHMMGAEWNGTCPVLVGQNNSYVVGMEKEGGIISHSGAGDRSCGDASAQAILSYLAPETSSEGISAEKSNDTKLARPAAVDPAPPSAPPTGMPRRDTYGNWLIYLFEPDAPAAIENARDAIENREKPWRLTYDPANAPMRMTSHDHLVELSIEDTTGGSRQAYVGRDEYPPAMAREGGSEAVVTYIEAGDHLRATNLIARQLIEYGKNPQPDGHDPLKAGDTFRYAVIYGDRTVKNLGPA
jgi:hypothetical protein